MHGCNPLDPHYSPSRNDDDECDNQLTHIPYCFLTVLAGPIPWRPPGHHDLRLFETVRHINFSPAAFPFPLPLVGSCFFCASSNSLDSDGSLHAGPSFSIAPFRSFKYLTLNPGQEATEPELSPRDPVSAIKRADERASNSV